MLFFDSVISGSGGGGGVAGMMLEELAAQAGTVEMEVDLRSGDALVSQHLLDGTQIRSTLEKVSGERVAHGVRTDRLPDSRQGGEIADYIERSNLFN